MNNLNTFNNSLGFLFTTIYGCDSWHLCYALFFLAFLPFIIFNFHDERWAAASSLVLALQLRIGQDDNL